MPWTVFKSINTNSIVAAFLVFDDNTSQQNQPVTINPMVPGQSQTVNFFFKNGGNIAGRLFGIVANLVSSENSHLQAEQDAGDTTSTTGELESFLNVTVFADIDQIYSGPLSGLQNEVTYVPSLQTGQEVVLQYQFTLDSNAPQTTMSDSVDFDFSYGLQSL